jgi:transcriptional antiterminator NusG
VEYARLDASKSPDVGDRAKTLDGPFAGAEGTVVRVVEERGLVEVVLTVFNRPEPVELESWQVERVS